MVKKEDILRSEIDTLTVDVVTLQAEVADLKSEVAALKASLDDKIHASLLRFQSEIMKSQLQKKELSQSSEQ